MFTLSFGRLRQRILLKCVPHVQHDYFSPFNQSDRSFLARRRCCCRRAFLSSLLCFHARTCVSNFCIYKRDKISSKLLPCRVYKLRPLETKLRLVLVQPCPSKRDLLQSVSISRPNARLKCVLTASEVRVNPVKTQCGRCLGTVRTRFRRLLAASKLSVNRSNHVQLQLRIVFI